jgi:hypothetical protein
VEPRPTSVVSGHLQRRVGRQPVGDRAVGGIQGLRQFVQVSLGLCREMERLEHLRLRPRPRLTVEQAGPRITPAVRAEGEYIARHCYGNSGESGR